MSKRTIINVLNIGMAIWLFIMLIGVAYTLGKLSTLEKLMIADNDALISHESVDTDLARESEDFLFEVENK